MPPQITCALAGKNGKRIARIQLVAACFFSIFDSRLILKLLCDSLNLVINAFSLRLLGGMVQEEGSRERCSSCTVLHA